MKSSEQVTILDGAWDQHFRSAAMVGASEVRIASPFIKLKAAQRLLFGWQPKRISVLTRFSLTDMAAGVSDLSALRFLMERGAKIRGIKHLHSKLYLFGAQRVIVTSANLTSAALTRDLELGFVSEDAGAIKKCRTYVDSLGSRAGADLTLARLNQWEGQVASAMPEVKKHRAAMRLPDHGVDVGFASQEEEVVEPFADGEQSFVKFFGKGDSRLPLEHLIWDEVKGSEAHLALSYPKRPRSVRNGVVMFIARLTSDPNDIRIYGRAIDMAYRDGQDDASPADIKRRWWKREYSHFIRIHDAVFIDGPLSNGISLEEMMAALGSSCFETIKDDPDRNPRLSIRRQAAVRLSGKGRTWMEKKFLQAIATHGRISDSDMAKLHWV